MSEARTRIDKQVQQNRYDALEARYEHLLKVNDEMAETITTLRVASEKTPEPIYGYNPRVEALESEVERLKVLLYQAKQELVERDQQLTRSRQSAIRMARKILDVRKIVSEGLTK
jgi:chromosome segregation ATPase